MTEAKLIGRVVNVKKKSAGANYTYGFIRTGAGGEFFFHRDDVIEGRMPTKGSTVRFTPIPKGKGKNERAAEIDIMSEPEHIPEVYQEPAVVRG